jgi:hypothetical protein
MTNDELVNALRQYCEQCKADSEPGKSIRAVAVALAELIALCERNKYGDQPAHKFTGVNIRVTSEKLPRPRPAPSEHAKPTTKPILQEKPESQGTVEAATALAKATEKVKEATEANNIFEVLNFVLVGVKPLICSIQREPNRFVKFHEASHETRAGDEESAPEAILGSPRVSGISTTARRASRARRDFSRRFSKSSGIKRSYTRL